jgi:protoheme IX farnesyltransferase
MAERSTSVELASSEQIGAAPSLRLLFALTKPRIAALSVATAAVGLALAPKRVPTRVGILALLGTWLIVAAANTLNMYVERDIDAKMARTRHRPLPSGRLPPGVALWFGIVQGVLGLLILTLFANALTGLLGAVALFIYVLVYTPMKERSIHALLVGAVAGAMPPLLGWTAATGELSGPGLGLFSVLFFWQIPHFLAIAMFRREDYRAARLQVMPNIYGETATRWAIACGLFFQGIATLALVPLGLGHGAYPAGALVLGAIMLFWAIVGIARSGGNAWARQLFFMTVGFLPLLFALLISG